MSKVEPALRAELERRVRLRRKRPGVIAELQPRVGEAVEKFDVAVMFTGDIEDLRETGFEPLTVVWHPDRNVWLAAGLIPVTGIEALGAISHVAWIEGSHPMQPLLNRSVPEIHADVPHHATPQITGDGVIIGIIDSGIDFRHKNFCKPAGPTRIITLWDQTHDAKPPEHAPSGFPFGVEYTEDDINAQLGITPAVPPSTPPVPVRAEDKDKHGTHVAGIATGNGFQTDCCDSGLPKYVGAGPRADLIIVQFQSDLLSTERDLGHSHNLVHAVNYIFGHPQRNGRPVVINISLGDDKGPHDGTTVLELMLETSLGSAGQAIVIAAGNARGMRRHAAATVPPGKSIDVPFTVPNTQANDAFAQNLELWYPDAGALSVTVEAPMPAGAKSPELDVGQRLWTVDPTLKEDRQTEVLIESRVSNPANSKRSIHVQLFPSTGKSLVTGLWKLWLRNTGAAEVTFDCWINGGNPLDRELFFTKHVTDATTVTIPASCESAIAVAAYADRSASWTDQFGTLRVEADGSLATFSSYGPLAGGTKIKPDIAAPGVSIKSAAALDDCPCCNCLPYLVESGTSQAAPHVTGVVAMMFQKNPGLSATEVKKFLMDSARRPDGVTGVLPNNEWGAGKVDAAKALEALDKVLPPPAPQPHTDAPSAGGPQAVGSAGSSRIAEAPTSERNTSGESHAGSRASGALHAATSPPQFLSGTGVPSAFIELHHHVLASPAGRTCAAVVSRHFSEVRGLINANLRVAVPWHRMGGPRLVHTVLHLPSQPWAGDTWPLDQERKRRVEQFLAALERHGSPRLQADVRRYRDAILTGDLAALMVTLAGPPKQAA